MILTDSEENEDGSVTASAEVAVSLLPSLNTETLRTQLQGRPTNQAQTILHTLPGFASVRTVITPRWLPPRLLSLPRNPNNIEIHVIAQ